MSEEKKQRGRPKKVESVNNSVSNGGDDDLKAFMKNKNTSTDNSESNNVSDINNDLDGELLKAIEENDGVQNDIPEDDFTPLSEPVQQRSYTSGNVGLSDVNNPNQPNNINNPQVVYTQDKIIDEPVYTNIGSTKTPDVDETLLNPQLAQEETKKSQNNNSGNSNSSNNSSNPSIDYNSVDKDNESKKKESSQNDIPQTEKKLSPKEIRDNAEKTADGILQAYEAFTPDIFSYFAKYNIKKLQKLHKEDKIDIKRPVFRDGSNFEKFANDFNTQVQSAFVVTEKEKETLREPLIDVLVEKEVALTPTQRLMTAAATVIIPKIVTVIQLNIQRNNDIKDMMQMHEETKELEYARMQKNNIVINTQANNPSANINTNSSTNNNSSNQAESNVKIVDLNENDKSQNVKPSLDDVINSDFENNQNEDDDDDDTVVTDFTEQTEEQNDIPE